MTKLISKLGVFLVVLGFAFLTPTAWAAEVDSGTEDGPQWEYVEAKTTYNRYHNVVSLNGLIYIIGGVDNQNVHFSRTVVFNPSTNKFHNAGELSIARYGSASVVYNGKIYCFGGETYDGAINTVEVFDPTTETWSVVDTVMPSKKYHLQAAVVGDKIFLIGGIIRDEKSLSTVDIYNPKTNTWETGSTGPGAICGFGSTVLEGKIYIFGGRSYSGNQVSFHNQIFYYDPAANAWTSAGNLPIFLDELSASSYNNKAIITGGYTDSGKTDCRKTYIYDPVTQTFTEGPDLQTTRYAHASTVESNTLYAIYGYHITGGYQDYATTMEKLDLSQLIPSPPSANNLTVLLNTDETIQLSVSNNLADNSGLTWTSSDSSVAQVDEDGKVTAVAPGECSISAENTGDAYQELIPVKVFDGNADQYRLAVNLKPKQTAKLHFTEDPTSTTWTSHDTAVATVNSTGRVTAVSDGLVIIEGEAASESQHIYVRVKL